MHYGDSRQPLQSKHKKQLEQSIMEHSKELYNRSKVQLLSKPSISRHVCARLLISDILAYFRGGFGKTENAGKLSLLLFDSIQAMEDDWKSIRNTVIGIVGELSFLDCGSVISKALLGKLAFVERDSFVLMDAFYDNESHSSKEFIKKLHSVVLSTEVEKLLFMKRLLSLSNEFLDECVSLMTPELREMFETGNISEFHEIRLSCNVLFLLADLKDNLYGSCMKYLVEHAEMDTLVAWLVEKEKRLLNFSRFYYSNASIVDPFMLRCFEKAKLNWKYGVTSSPFHQLLSVLSNCEYSIIRAFNGSESCFPFKTLEEIRLEKMDLSKRLAVKRLEHNIEAKAAELGCSKGIVIIDLPYLIQQFRSHSETCPACNEFWIFHALTGKQKKKWDYKLVFPWAVITELDKIKGKSAESRQISRLLEYWIGRNALVEVEKRSTAEEQNHTTLSRYQKDLVKCALFYHSITTTFIASEDKVLLEVLADFDVLQFSPQ